MAKTLPTDNSNAKLWKKYDTLDKTLKKGLSEISDEIKKGFKDLTAELKRK